MAAPVIFEPVVYKRAYQKQSHLRSTWWTEKVPKMIECQKLPDPQTKPKPTPHSVKPDLETEKLVEALNKYFKEVDDYNLAEEVEEPSPVKARDSKSSDGSLELELPPSSSVQGAFSLIDRSSKLLPLFFFFFLILPSFAIIVTCYQRILPTRNVSLRRRMPAPQSVTKHLHPVSLLFLLPSLPVLLRPLSSSPVPLLLPFLKLPSLKFPPLQSPEPAPRRKPREEQRKTARRPPKELGSLWLP